MRTEQLERIKAERELMKAITLEPIPQLNIDGLEAAARSYADNFMNQSVSAAGFLAFMEGYRCGRKDMLDSIVEPARDQAYTCIKAYEQIFTHLVATCGHLDKRNAELDELHKERLRLREEVSKLNNEQLSAAGTSAKTIMRLERELQEANSNHVNKDLQIEVNNLTFQIEQKDIKIQELTLGLAAVNDEAGERKLMQTDALRLLQEVFAAMGHSQDTKLRPGSYLYKRIEGYLEIAK